MKKLLEEREGIQREMYRLQNLQQATELLIKKKLVESNYYDLLDIKWNLVAKVDWDKEY